jgi:deuterolysin
VLCPPFWNLPAVTNVCHGQDRATTLIHEETHLRIVKGTYDYAEGYIGALSLNQSASLNNADNYAYYANAVWVGNGCY